jgi:spore coat polysaccharide biosynthesis protein SpsF
MEDGQSVKMNVIAIIQARLTSSRLPGKVLLPLPFPNGKPIVANIIQKLGGCKRISKIIVATSNSKGQERLIDYFNSQHQPYFAGDELDVLSRFKEIVSNELPDCILRITSDNPFIDLPILDQVIDYHIQSKNDYTYTEGLPYGMNIELFNKTPFLHLANRTDLTTADKEHVTFKFKHCSDYKVERFLPLGEEDFSHLRVTVDTREDYMRAALLYAHFNTLEASLSDLEVVINFYSIFPHLFPNEI